MEDFCYLKIENFRWLADSYIVNIGLSLLMRTLI